MSTDTETKEEGQPSQELVPTQPPMTNERKQLIEDVLGGVGAPTLHNFQGSSMEVWQQIAKITAMQCKTFQEVTEEGIDLHKFYVHGVEFVDEKTGEVTGGIRCVLIPKEGEPFAFVSDGIARDLSGIIRTFGFGPYDPPISVKPVAVRTRKGRLTYRLIPID